MDFEKFMNKEKQAFNISKQNILESMIKILQKDFCRSPEKIICHIFFGKTKAENYRQFIGELLSAYKVLRCIM